MGVTTETAEPTIAEMETAMSVLLWLHQVTNDGQMRDNISDARFLLDEAIEERETDGD